MYLTCYTCNMTWLYIKDIPEYWLASHQDGPLVAEQCAKTKVLVLSAQQFQGFWQTPSGGIMVK